MRYRRVDENQATIIRELKSLGLSVHDTSKLGEGFPDIAVGFSGVNFLFEIKTTKKGKLTPSEIKFFEEWDGQVVKIYSTESTLTYMREYFFNDGNPHLAAQIQRLLLQHQENDKS